MADFSFRLLDWYAVSGRHDLPWQQHVTPYRVWVSEIMLQQTQVSTVIPYYERFMQRFPEISGLAEADLDAVLHIWSGLGYYSRARNLHRTAGIVMREFAGHFPDTIAQLLALPGIGRSTAGAILALSMNQAQPILDGNVKRVLCRYYAIQAWPGEPATTQELWRLAEQLVARDQPAAYTQAMMDLGAMLCTRTNPDCNACPLQSGCQARQLGLQQVLPVRKPRPSLPVKQAAFLIIAKATGEILLQRRPPAGVWGGLWGFPECSVETDISAWLHKEYGLLAASIRFAPSLRHTFTHFHLDITPVRVQLQAPQDRVRDTEDLYWYKLTGDNRLLGMATPVRELISRYNQANEEI
ncbi:MAG: A/G-specific adenine glycosylase [Gammaproteobacteria bacterium RIFCSPLOWO2_12_FULL_52_10]|nr:MAG: A/G-specific adenine glycosylase [Gammaproteobacteria bacterium RIFCSPLOWO2_12_FULL_52_10]